VKDWRSVDWLILRPLVVVAIVWATMVVALVTVWIRRFIASHSQRRLANAAFRHLMQAALQVGSGKFNSHSPVRSGCDSADDRESRAA
jgi:hypothetical protein